jgi:hypothetical protein
MKAADLEAARAEAERAEAMEGGVTEEEAKAEAERAGAMEEEVREVSTEAEAMEGAATEAAREEEAREGEVEAKEAEAERSNNTCHPAPPRRLPEPPTVAASSTRDKHNNGWRLKNDHADTSASPAASSVLPHVCTCARCASDPARSLKRAGAEHALGGDPYRASRATATSVVRVVAATTPPLSAAVDVRVGALGAVDTNRSRRRHRQRAAHVNPHGASACAAIAEVNSSTSRYPAHGAYVCLITATVVPPGFILKTGTILVCAFD